MGFLVRLCTLKNYSFYYFLVLSLWIDFTAFLGGFLVFICITNERKNCLQKGKKTNVRPESWSQIYGHISLK